MPQQEDTSSGSSTQAHPISEGSLEGKELQASLIIPGALNPHQPKRLESEVIKTLWVRKVFTSDLQTAIGVAAINHHVN